MSFKMHNRVEGIKGEKIAKDYLKKKGYYIRDVNVTYEFGEIDIVAYDKNNILVFIEVKSRNTLEYGRPYEAVDYRKQNKIRRLAQMYLVSEGFDSQTDLRFDIIEVLGDKVINHIENAF